MNLDCFRPFLKADMATTSFRSVISKVAVLKRATKSFKDSFSPCIREKRVSECRGRLMLVLKCATNIPSSCSNDAMLSGAKPEYHAHADFWSVVGNDRHIRASFAPWIIIKVRYLSR